MSIPVNIVELDINFYFGRGEIFLLYRNSDLRIAFSMSEAFE